MAVLRALTRPGSNWLLVEVEQLCEKSNSWLAFRESVYPLLPLDTSGGDTGLNFLPHADASPAQPLQAHSGFRVMEDGICTNIGKQRTPASSCGVVDVTD